MRRGWTLQAEMAKAQQVRVLLMRTGESTWEAQGRMGGLADVPLSPAGREQVLGAIESLGEVRLSAVVSGPDECSAASAGLLAKATGATARRVEDLAEVDMGLWEGLMERDLAARCPSAYRQWSECPASVCAPSGEVPAHAAERLMDALARVFERARGDQGAVAVVLRPMAFSLVSAALRGESSRECGAICRCGGQVEWHTVGVEDVRRGLVRATG